MRVFIANFGRGNWAWPTCRQNSTLALMDNERLHPFWKTSDREGYVRAAIQYLRLGSGAQVTKQVASRWFNLNTVFEQTSGDLWIHREKEELWWTISSDVPGTEELMTDPNPRAGDTKNARIFLFQKPCAPWESKDKKGRPLVWANLHKKAREFLFTEGTGQQLSAENAEYASALIDGQSLTPWHSRPMWKAKEFSGGKYAGTVYDDRQKTVTRMAMDVYGTSAQSGQSSVVIKKDKQILFATQAQLEGYLSDLLAEQEGRCKLTDIPMQLDSGDDSRLRCSVDRIDSSGHYAPGNLQLVCRFVNFWKRDDTNEEFSRLLERVRHPETVGE